MDTKNSIIRGFDGFREELDEFNDRRERLIKASRDITNLSKKTIFLLHRLVLEDENPSDEVPVGQRAARTGRDKLQQVQEMYAGMKGELEGDRFWRHQRQVSPGLQEYIEALSFAHYLEFGTLITFVQVQETICDVNGVPYFPLTIQDYLLGLSDLTGELMRFAISGLTRRGGRAKAIEVCAFVRNCKADLERLAPYMWELSKKQTVTAQSLQKIEDAVYALVVRGSEYDLPPDMLEDIVAQSISNFTSVGRGEPDYGRPKGTYGDEEDYP